MKTRIQLLPLVVALLFASGCTSLDKQRPVHVIGEFASELEMVILPFHPPYLDYRILVRVSSPESMSGEIVSLSIKNGWGPKAVTYGSEDEWKGRSGLIEFDVDPRDIQVRKDEPKRINVDRLKKVKAAEP
jgi:hypothetical protein